MGSKTWDDAGHQLHALRERMSRSFEEELPRARGEKGGAFAPATDVYLTEENVVVTVELPGVDQGGISVECQGLVLIISGERPFHGDGQAHQIERSYGPFLRSLPLPPGTRVAERRVRFEDGLLTIELPRSP